MKDMVLERPAFSVWTLKEYIRLKSNCGITHKIWQKYNLNACQLIKKQFAIQYPQTET